MSMTTEHKHKFDIDIRQFTKATLFSMHWNYLLLALFRKATFNNTVI